MNVSKLVVGLLAGVISFAVAAQTPPQPVIGQDANAMVAQHNKGHHKRHKLGHKNNHKNHHGRGDGLVYGSDRR